MAWTKVGDVGTNFNASVNGSNQAVITGASFSLGNLIVVRGIINSDTTTVTGVTDTAGNTYTVVSNQHTSGDVTTAFIALCLGAAHPLSSGSITVQFSAFGQAYVHVSEFTGETSPLVDRVAGRATGFGLPYSTATTQALVNTTSGNSAGSATTIPATAAAHTAGNANYVAVMWSGNTTVQSVTDTAGNTYVSTGQKSNNGTTDHVEIFYAENIIGNAANVVTATFASAATFLRILVHHVSGSAPTGSYVAGQGGTGLVTGTSVTSSSWITPNASTYLIAGMGSTGSGSAIVAGTGYTIELNAIGGDSTTEDRIVTTTGTYTGSLSWTTSQTAWLAAASFSNAPITSQADEIAFGVAANGSGGATTSSPSSGWIEETDANASSAGRGYTDGYQVLSTVSGVAYSGNWSASTSGPVLTVTVKGTPPTPSSTTQDVRITGIDYPRQQIISIGQQVRITGTAGGGGTSFTTQDVRLTGTNNSSTAQDVRVTGQSSSSQAQDTRITGQSTSSTSQDARLTGQSSSSQTQDVRLTGQSTSSTSQDVRISGQLASSTSQDIRITGQATSSTAYDVRITGQSSSSTSQDTRITGQATSSLAQDVRTTGQSTSSTTQDARLTGQQTSSASQDVRVTGQATSNQVQDARITGQLTSSDNRDVRITGQSASSTSQDTRITGQATSSSSQDVRTTGQSTSSQSQDVRISGQLGSNQAQDIRITGQATTFSAQDVRVTGQLDSTTNQDVRITGITGSAYDQDVRIVGQDSSNTIQDVRITGTLGSTYSQDARIVGQDTSSVTTDIHIVGQLISSQTQDVRITGTNQSSTSQDVRITGQASTSFAQDIRITGTQGSSYSQDARITGQDSANASQDIRITGTASSSTSQDVRINAVGQSSMSQTVKMVGYIPGGPTTVAPKVIIVDGEVAILIAGNYYMRI